MNDLSDEDFKRLYTFMQEKFGIDLKRKKPLIVSRLTSILESRGYTDFHDYVNDIIQKQDQDMMTTLLNKLTTNYTYFMREESHFDYLENVVMPQLAEKHKNDRVLSIWSAGCSSGEEPYNISMYLLEYFGKLGGNWDTRILATDISQNVLSKAEDPKYLPESLEKLPKSWKNKYFVPIEDGYYTVSEELRKNVIFRPFNLMSPIQFKRDFDLIFCRNVMIYFDQPTKDALVKRFYDVTYPGGHLFIGHSEGLTKATCPYTYVKPAIYRRDEK